MEESTMRNAWPAASIVIAAMACVTILAGLHAASSDLLTLISAAVVPTVTMLLVGSQLSGQVDQVKHQVNGRMSELIAQRERAIAIAEAAGVSVPEVTTHAEPAEGPPPALP